MSKKLFRVTVQDFGAHGDGFWNDSEAFRAAKLSKADVIEMPRATYVIDSDIKLDQRFRPAHKRVRRI